MLSREKIRKLVSNVSQVVEPEFKIYSPDENIELTNDDGATPFCRSETDSEQIASIDPNWQFTKTLFIITLATSTPPSTTANYWVEVNGIKETTNFGKYVQKHGFFTLYLIGN